MSVYTAFSGHMRLAVGDLAETASAAWRAHAADLEGPILVFDRATGAVVDLDLRGAEEDVRGRYAEAAPTARRGRPSLGVVAREVTLLPRHWDWLGKQPGGASTTLRRLVDEARKSDASAARERTDATYRFISGIGGDLPGFEAYSRALFAGDEEMQRQTSAGWPEDIRDELAVMISR
jgi:hypothetical protein